MSKFSASSQPETSILKETIPENVFVGRQPIFTADLEIHAYELLFRSNVNDTTADVIDGELATSQILVNTFLEIGSKSIVGDKPAFVNLTKKFILGDQILNIDHEKIVIEILEDVEVDLALVNRIQELSSKGYAIALDDFIYHDKYENLLSSIDIIKIDILPMTNAEIENTVSRLKPYGVKLLAEKIESIEEYNFCKSLGFDYYQGYFLSKPSIIKGQRVPTNHMNVLKLMQQLYQEDVNLAEIEESICKDLSLSYRLLKNINSSYYGIKSKIKSVNHALVLLGIDKVRQWATLIAMTRLNDKPGDLIANSLTRAKMAEELAVKNGFENTKSFFTAGLFSNLDAIISIPMESLLDELPLSDTIKAAILYGEGDIGAALQCAIHYENSRWEEIGSYPLPISAIVSSYIDSLDWTNQIMGSLNDI